MKNTKSKQKISKLMVEEIPHPVKTGYFQGGSSLSESPFPGKAYPKENSEKMAYYQGNALAGAVQDDCGGDEDKMQSKSQVTALAVQSFVYVAKREGFTKAKLIALINDEWKEDRKI